MSTFRIALALAAALALAGCGDGHDHNGHGHDHGHHHKAPHGGTLVVVGKEAAHIEFTLEKGELTAYILDAHAENGVRIKQLEIKLTVTIAGASTEVALAAREVATTKEKPGDTSEFGATVEALKGVTKFDAVIASLTIKGQTFTKVAFPFPEGNEATAHGSH